MKKIIEVSRTSLIVCDNPKCSYTIPFSEKEEQNLHKYVNKPCPMCGENLLTEQDYLQDQKLKRLVRWVNRWFGWMSIFARYDQTFSVHVHDGVKIKNLTNK